MHLPSRSLPWGLAAFLLANLLASQPMAEAGQDRWTPIGLGAGFVQSLAVDPTVPGVVYAAAGIYRSDDAAQSWQWRGAPTVNLDSWTSVIVAPDDPQRLYATTRPTQTSNGAVYTSGDAGLHWQELFRIRVGFTSVAASPNGTILAATPLSEVYRSGDGGSTWSRVLVTEHSSDPPLRVFVDPLAPETAYATGREFWRSTDSGITWARIGTWPNGEPGGQCRRARFSRHRARVPLCADAQPPLPLGGRRPHLVGRGAAPRRLRSPCRGPGRPRDRVRLRLRAFREP